MPPNQVDYSIEILLIVMCLTYDLLLSTLGGVLAHLELRVSFVSVPEIEVVKFSLNLVAIFF